MLKIHTRVASNEWLNVYFTGFTQRISLEYEATFSMNGLQHTSIERLNLNGVAFLTV